MNPDLLEVVNEFNQTLKEVEVLIDTVNSGEIAHTFRTYSHSEKRKITG